MAPGNAVRLLTLADREFRQLTAARPVPPPSRKFKPIRLNVARLEQGWERKRAAAVRLAAVLLREDDATLQRRVCENEKSTKTYATAVDWLQREPAYMRKVAPLLDLAGSRVSSLLGRCAGQRAVT